VDLTDLIGNSLDFCDGLADAVAWCTDPEALDVILPLAGHADPAVRRSVAQVLPRITAVPRPAYVVETLVRLTNDASPDVRDSATHALGTRLSEVDTQEVRDALAARVFDPHRGTACEALVGLARRFDPRVLPALRSRLSGDDVWLMELMAAGTTGDPSLYPLVRAHLCGWPAALVPKVCATVRLTDPDGLGTDLLDGLADWYGRPPTPVAADRYWWSVALNILEQAPHRAEDLADAVWVRIADDREAANRFLSSALGRTAAMRGWRPTPSVS
jgi:hypothetical protein